MAKYAYYARNHAANSLGYMLTNKTDLEVRKWWKEINQKPKQITPIEDIGEAKSTGTGESQESESECKEKSSLADMEIELESSNGTYDAEKKPSEFFVDKNENYSKNYYYW